MPHAELTDAVRRLVGETFAGLGVTEPGQVHESLLIRAGSYCGRRFESAEASAIWFVEEHQVKFYRAGGELARVVALAQPCLARAA